MTSMNPAVAAAGSGSLAAAAVTVLNGVVQHFWAIVPDVNFVTAEVALATALAGVGAHYLTRTAPPAAPAVAETAPKPVAPVTGSSAAAIVFLVFMAGTALVGCSYFTPTTTTAADGTVTTAPSKAAAAVATVDAALPDAYKLGCGAISVADGYFQAAAPALVIAGKLQQADLDSEKAIFAGAEATCNHPPADLATAGTQLIAQAGSIYLLLATK